MFRIQKDVPLPARQRASKYPFADMDIGDSFYLSQYLSRGSVKAAAHAFGKKQSPIRKFVVRKENTGARIWRVE